MGLLLSILVSYAGVREIIECYQRIKRGVLPDEIPDFGALAERYALELREAANHSHAMHNWLEDGSQGYLCLKEDDAGNITSACIKYYGNNSAAILFSSKISSFGQDSVEDETWSIKTQLSQSRRSPSAGKGDRSPSPSYENGDVCRPADDTSDYEAENKEKFSCLYKPSDPVPDSSIPQIQFQPCNSEREDEPTPRQESENDESFQRSTLQRSEANRRSFRTRHSSSSPSSRESREEELRVLTSLEEAELGAPAATPPELDSFDEKVETVPDDKVTDEELDDFWGSSTDW